MNPFPDNAKLNRRQEIQARSRKMKAISSYKTGWTINQIAEHMGLHRKTVSGYIRDVDIKDTPKKEIKQEKLDYIIQRADTHTEEMLRQELNIGVGTLKDYLRFMRKDPKNPRAVAARCPHCNEIKKAEERHQTKAATLSICEECFQKKGIKTREQEIEIDPVILSARIRMKHQVEWRNGYSGSLSPGYLAMQYE